MYSLRTASTRSPLHRFLATTCRRPVSVQSPAKSSKSRSTVSDCSCWTGREDVEAGIKGVAVTPVSAMGSRLRQPRPPQPPELQQRQARPKLRQELRPAHRLAVDKAPEADK